jgi:DNA modification methylase
MILLKNQAEKRRMESSRAMPEFSQMDLTAQKIRSDFARLPFRKEWSFRDAQRKEMYAHTHGYHRYPAKFIPQIVKQLIASYAPTGKEVICDPFGGCGTTLVEAKISGRKSIGFDINPIAKLITQVKVTPINPRLLEKYRMEFVRKLKNTRIKKVRHHQRISYWFDARTTRQLDGIYLAIKKIKNPDIKKFFLCAFSHNLKNSSRWLMKSIKPTIDKKKIVPNPKESFLRHLDLMVRKNREFYNELSTANRLWVKTAMYRRDSTRLLPLRSNSVDLIITSPPYVTSYEYADLHQLSLLWFGDDFHYFKKWHRFSNNFNDFRKQFIGTTYKQTSGESLESIIAQGIVNELIKVDRPLAADVANYFTDVSKALAEMYRILKPGGKACVIVGNTALRGVDILNAEVTAEQMSQLGFEKVDFIKREVSNKMITPWRDKKTGKFTDLNNPNKKRVYEYEYVIVMEK